MTLLKKLSIGTAQFGLNYGVANKLGKPSLEKSKNIINAAQKYGLSMIDTASAYGDSESVLGEIGVSDFKITTKIPAIPDNQQNIESVIDTGIDSVCIATAITLAKDPEKTTKRLSKYFNI